MRRYLPVLLFVLLAASATTGAAQVRIARPRVSATPQFSSRPQLLPQRGGYGVDWYQRRPGTWSGNAIYRTWKPSYPLYQTRGTSRGIRRRRR